MDLLATVVAVNVEDRLAVTDGGETFALTELFDVFGDETDEASEARSAVGQHPCGRWVALDLSDFEKRLAN